MENKIYRFNSLDILKFICSIIIFLHHFQGYTKCINIIDIRNGTKTPGSYAVLLFFIISGFVIAQTLEKVTDNKFKDFIVHKLSRIYPIAIISTLCSIVLRFIFFLINKYYLNEIKLGFWTITNSLLLTYSGSFIQIEKAINGQFWFVCQLIVAYIIMYFVVYVSNRIKIDHRYIFFLLAAYGLMNEDFVISLFFLGILLYYFYNFLLKKDLFNKVSIFSFIIFITIIVLGILRYDIFFDYPTEIVRYILCPCLILFIIRFDDGKKNSIASILGGVSFEVYAWHNDFLIILMILQSLNLGIFNENYNILFEICFTLVIILFSMFIYKTVEIPLNKKVENKLNELFK